jgi:hypothetical protein
MNSRTKTDAPFALMLRFGVSLLWLLIIAGNSDTCSAFSSQSQSRAPLTRINTQPTIALRVGCHHRYSYDSRQSLHRLQASPDESNSNSNSNSKETSTKASVRFSGIDLDKDNTATNPIDYLLRLITSDVGSIVLGLSGVVLLLVGRSLLDNGYIDSLTATAGMSITAMQVESMGQETRSNLLAVFACGAVLLNGISKLDITSVLAETVTLEGKELDAPLLVTTDQSSSLLKSSSSVQWVLESLLTATPAKTAVLLQRTEGSWKILALAGIVPDAWAAAALSSAKDTPQLLPYMPIIERFQSGSNRESYLPTLQALPGRSEFTYLPDNTQAVLLIPVLTGDSTAAATAAATTTVLALGADQARSFTPRNVAWSQAVAAKLAAEMEESYS